MGFNLLYRGGCYDSSGSSTSPHLPIRQFVLGSDWYLYILVSIHGSQNNILMNGGDEIESNVSCI